MTTAIENKKPVKADWQTSKVQTEVLKSVATIYASLEKTLSKSSPEIVAEVNKTLLINKGYYQNQPIQTPLDLVNAIAEYTANVLGIKVAIAGEPNKASIVFEGGTLANQLAAINNVPPNQAQTLVDYVKNGLADLGAQFGFKTEITTAQPDFIVTFNK